MLICTCWRRFIFVLLDHTRVARLNTTGVTKGKWKRKTANSPKEAQTNFVPNLRKRAEFFLVADMQIEWKPNK